MYASIYVCVHVCEFVMMCAACMCVCIHACVCLCEHACLLTQYAWLIGASLSEPHRRYVWAFAIYSGGSTSPRGPGDPNSSCVAAPAGHGYMCAAARRRPCA